MNFQPLFFEKNRVRRVYTGGKLFDTFLGDGSCDGFFPEEWIASAVIAKNREMSHPKEGVSRVRGANVDFDDLLAAHPTEMLGSQGKMRILVKYLDSAIRLPAQAHPDRAFSKKYFQSEYGKTESWIVLATRPDAKIFFGFREGVDEAAFRQAIADSETDLDAMERLMCSITPKVGDVYLVPAKTVHAIGAGCLILEVQEPTDFTIQPEHFCGEYRLSEAEMYLGLTQDEAVGCFDFTTHPEPQILPKAETLPGGVVREHLIDTRHTPCFVIRRIRCQGGSYPLALSDTFGVYIVTAGKGVLRGASYQTELKQGDYFFVPAAAMGSFSIEGDLECIECY